jgi:hypothetical protein
VISAAFYKNAARSVMALVKLAAERNATMDSLFTARANL